MNNLGLFDVEEQNDVLIVAPTTNLSELLYAQLVSSGALVFDWLAKSPLNHVVLDLERCDYGGSSALGMFLKMWKWVSSRGGKMVLCNVSANEREVLQVMKLDQLWTICDSRQAALDHLHDGS